jgi:hypothetical protein
MFALLIFTLYIIALVVTNKIDIEIPTITWGRSMEEYVTSKNPQSTAEAEYWMNQYLRKSFQ